MAKKRGQDDQTANTIGAPNVDEGIKEIEENIGTAIMPKVAIPRIGWIDCFKDHQENKHMIMQHD